MQGSLFFSPNYFPTGNKLQFNLFVLLGFPIGSLLPLFPLPPPSPAVSCQVLLRALLCTRNVPKLAWQHCRNDDQWLMGRAFSLLSILTGKEEKEAPTDHRKLSATGLLRVVPEKPVPPQMQRTCSMPNLFQTVKPQHRKNSIGVHGILKRKKLLSRRANSLSAFQKKWKKKRK